MARSGCSRRFIGRALQHWLEADPVSEQLISLRIAIRVPSVSNAQNWVFVIVGNAEQRHQLGIFRHASDIAAPFYPGARQPPHL